MRHLIIFPLAFLSGVDGFLLFAPYLLAVLVIAQVLQRRRLAASLVPVAPPRSIAAAIAEEALVLAVAAA